MSAARLIEKELRLEMVKWTMARVTALAAIALATLFTGTALANSLQSVKVSQGPDNSQIVRISLTDTLAKMPLHFTTANPHRVVLDFAGVQNPLGRQSETVNAGAVRAYNVAQAADRTRVVIDLSGPATYDIRQEKNVLLVALRGSATSKPGEAVPAHFEGDTAASIRDIAFRRGKNGEGRIEVALSEAGVGVDIKQKGQTVQVDFLNATLPKNLQRRLDVSEFATAAQTVETFGQGKSTRMVVTPKGKWDFFAYQTGKSFILEVTSLDAKTPGTAKKRYDGEKLSLDFQNVEVRAVLKVIADFTGLNIVAAESVAGNVTIRLKDVPWDQALDIILRTKGLDKRESGNVIWIAPREELMSKEKQELEAMQQLSEIEELQTEIIRLNYMRAPDAYAILSGKSITSTQAGEMVKCSTKAEGVGGKTESASGSTGAAGGTTNSMISKRGTVNFDLKTNSLFVQDTRIRIDKIKALLADIDIPARQIMIEARVVMASDTFSRALGARLAFGAKLGNSRQGNDAGISTGTGSADIVRNTTDNLVMPGFINNPAKNAGGVLGLSIIEGAGNAILGLELEALEADNRGKIVSNPRVVTQNQTPAVIASGVKVPVVTPGNANSAPTVSYEEILLCLLVDPQVLNNDDIILNVEVQKDVPSATVAPNGGNIGIDTKRVKTQIRIKNGDTAVLGGIFDQQQSNNTSKVPLLGDIPILGLLFRNNYKEDLKTELLIFLTPRLLDDSVTFR
jgi:type IV pilus assembly protein PilQ